MVPFLSPCVLDRVPQIKVKLTGHSLVRSGISPKLVITQSTPRPAAAIARGPPKPNTIWNFNIFIHNPNSILTFTLLGLVHPWTGELSPFIFAR